LDTSFYINDNQTIRSVGTWVSSIDDSRYLGYVDASSGTDTLHLFGTALETNGTDFLLGYVLNNPTGDTPKTKSVLNRQGQNIVLSRYQIGSDSLWGYEEVDDNGQTQLHLMEQHWYNTTSWGDNDGAFSASETLITGQALYSGSDSLANRTLVLGTLQTGAMYQEVDLIDMSVADVLGDGATDFVGTLYGAIKDTREFLSNDDSGGIDGLADYFNEQMRTAFGLDDSFSPLTFGYQNSTFKADFDLTYLAEGTFDVDLDLADLNLGSIFDATGLSASAEAALDVAAYAELSAGIGFDLSDITSPELFLDADSGFRAGASAAAENIDIFIGLDAGVIGKLGLIVSEGTISADVNFAAGFEEIAQQDGDDLVFDGRIGFGEVVESFNIGGEVSLEADLPLYFPIKALPIGGTTGDRNQDGRADNTLHFDTSATVTLDEGFVFDGVNYQMPSFNMDFDLTAALFAIINNPTEVIRGLDTFFDGINSVADGLGDIELPVIGSDIFSGVKSQLKGLQDIVMETGFSAPSGYENIAVDGEVTLTTLLDEMETRGDGVFEVLIQSLREALYLGLKGIDDPLFYFAVPNLDEFGELQYQADGKILTKKATSADDIQLLLSSDGELSFNIMFAGVLLGELNNNEAVFAEELDASDLSGRVTGLNNDGTEYRVSLVVEGANNDNPQSVVVSGSDAQDFSALISKLNLQTKGATWGVTDGKLKLTHNNGISSVAIEDQGLFANLVSFSGFLAEGVTEDIDIDFSSGISGLSLEVDAKIQVLMDYLMGIGLGINAGGIYLDTSGINAMGEEIAMDVSAVFTTEKAPGSTLSHEDDEATIVGAYNSVSGTLGFLTMDVYGEAGLNGHLGLDIAGGADNKWNGGAIELSLNASAEAYANIYAEVATSAGAILPSMSTFIEYDQVLGDATWSSSSGFEFVTGSPEVMLYDVSLDAGSLMGSFLGETLNGIKEIIEPMRPVIDLLSLELDLGIAKFQLIDIAYLKLPAKTVDTAKAVIQVIKSTLEFIDSTDSLDGDINFGDFNLGASFLEDPDSEVSEEETKAVGSDPTQKREVTGQTASTTAAKKGPNQRGLDKGKEKRFKLPILDDPASALGLITGRPVDLFWYDLPDLDLNFTYRKSFPVFPGLNAGIVWQRRRFHQF